MKVMLSCNRPLPASITLERFKHCLEHLLELQGAAINRAQGLPRRIIYASVDEAKYALLCQQVQRYGLELRQQGVYRGT